MNNDRVEQVIKNFLTVRDALAKGHRGEIYNLAFKKPWKFYREHTSAEAIEILKQEVKEN